MILNIIALAALAIALAVVVRVLEIRDQAPHRKGPDND